MNELPDECEKCGKKLSPMAVEDSYHATFSIGEPGRVFCRKHLDEHRREKWD